MISYGHQSINEKDIKAVSNTLKSEYLTQGPKIKAFEETLAKYCQAKYAVTTNSGTSALHIAYICANLKKGDEVITTPNTFVATTNMLLAVGAKPIFCDINPKTYNIDENKIESLVTKKTKAVVVVHFAGYPCNLDKIWKIAKKHKLIVIEDAAHALGSKYKNKPIGSGKSDITTLSFHPVKPITTGEGGALITNSEEIYNKAIKLRSHNIDKDENGFNVATALGYNYRMPDINAALGLSQMEKLDTFIKKRGELSKTYLKLINQKNIILPEYNLNNKYDSSWHIYVIRTKKPKHRLPLYNFLKQNNIGANFHYPPVYSHPLYKNIGYKNIKLPITDNYSKTAITIPLHQNLKKSDIKKISSIINNFFNNGN